MPKAIWPSLIGLQFGKLLALELDTDRSTTRRKYIKCECVCGSITSTDADHLRAGRIKSCGCSKKRHVISTMDHTLEYQSWCAMISRCTNSKSAAYPYYGGRGISVCERWLDFSSFYSDMGERPTANHSLGRIDNEIGYAPNNVRWETQEQQAANTSKTKFVEHEGVRVSLIDFCAAHGLDRANTYQRLFVYGWTVADALTVPIGGRRPKLKENDKC